MDRRSLWTNRPESSSLPADVEMAISTRLAVILAVAAAVLQGVASLLYVAAGNFDIASEWSGDVTKILASGTTGAALIRWGSRADMLGYLSIAPVVLHLRQRYAGERFIDLYAVAGLGFVVIGSIGAAVMASSAPSLIEPYATASDSYKHALALTFSTLYREIVIGMWNTLEVVPASVWAIGTALVARRRGPRSLFVTLSLLGVVTGGIALARLVSI